MVFYGLLSRPLEQVIEWYVTRDAAETDLAAVLRDEIDWRGDLETRPSFLLRREAGRSA